MRGRVYAEDDDEYEEDPRNDGGGGDWQPSGEDDDEDDEPDDSSDSDFGANKKSKARKSKKGTPAKPKANKAAASRRPASKRSRKHMSSDESEADDSDSDDDAGDDDGWAPAARTGSRPRRQAAQKATANIKHTYEEDDDDGDGAAVKTGGAYAAAANAGYAQPATADGNYRGSYRSHGFSAYAAETATAQPYQSQYGYEAVQDYPAGGYPAQGYAAVEPSSNYGDFGAAAASRPDRYTAVDHSTGYQSNLAGSYPAGQHQQEHAEAVAGQHASTVTAAADHDKAVQQHHGSRHIFIKTSAQTRAVHQTIQQHEPADYQQHAHALPDMSRTHQQALAAAAYQPQEQQHRPARRSAAKHSYKDSGSDGYDEADDEDDDDEFDVDSDASEDDDIGHEADEDDEDDDYQYAQQLQEQWNGLRSRNTRSHRAGGGSSQSPPARSGSAGLKRGASWRPAAGGGSKRSRTSQRTSTRAIAKVSYAESGDSESEEEGRGSQARREPVPALDDVGCDEKPGQHPYDEVERVLGHRDIPGTSAADCSARWDCVEFHIKWKSYSYTHCSWEPLGALRQLGGFKRVTNYCRRAELVETNRPYLSREELELQDVQRQMEEELIEQYTQVERVVSERPDSSRCLLVKWEGLPYCECTWETEADVMAAKGGPEARDAFLARQQRLQEPSKGVDAARSSFISSKRSIGEMDAQPEFLTGGKLRDYQLEGINWLTYAWIKGRNCILADEMGLGKTVQCVSFLGLLAETCSVRGPFLVVVPLSTVPNWIKEFRKWVPMLNALVYVGNGRSREVIRAFEFGGSFNQPGSTCSNNNSNRSRPYNFEVLITTYELVLKDAPLLSRINWAYLMVDEAHRLKNSESALYQELASWHFKNKLLITGTPLQNSLKELWALLHFLDPGRFSSCEEFEAAYSLQDSEQVSQLHAALKPHLLRRVIKEVEKSLPPKNERILRVEMTPLQRQYYKWILARNFKELNKGARSGGHVSLLNIISELKKACNHPFLFESAEDEYRGSEEDKSVVDRLILTSGKMVLLDKLLRRLRATGHRVLLFSQMVRVLDIISDYLRLRGWSHQRLDGSTPAAQRHAAMEAFNKPDSPDFAFLLSTRAGGLGINLATADTVIIFDSDWNPQNDLQAMSRAHRIGQTETVNIYRFVTSGSVEEEILERAKRKMVLDHLVIQRMDTSGRTVLDPAAGGGNKTVKAMFGKDELAAILRFGAEDLFKAAEEGSAERSKQLLEEDIDAILERAELVEDNPGATAGPEGAADLLSSFNVATFKNAEDDATFWSRLIREEDRPKEEIEQPLGLRAARIKALGGDDDEVKPGIRSRSGSQEATDAEHEDGGHKQAATGKGKKSKRRKGGSNDPGPPVEGAVLRVDEWRWDVGESGRPANTQDGRNGASPSPAAHMLSRRDATAFVRAVRRHGLKSRLPAIAAEVGGALEDADSPQLLSLWRALVDGCQRALDVAQQSGQQHDGKDVTLDFFGCAVKAGELKHHLSSMSLLAKRIESLTQAQQDPALYFRLEASAVPPAAKWGKAVGWTPRDDAALLLGVYYHGLGHWEAIIGDERLGLQGKLQCVLANKEEGGGGGGDKSVMPKASHLETRVLGILRKMLSSSSKPAAASGSMNRSASSQRPTHLPPKKAAAARAAAMAASLQRKPTPPPASTAATGSAFHATPPRAADINGSAAGTTAAAGEEGPEYGPFTAAQLHEQLSSAQDSLKQLAEVADKDLEPRQVMALTKKHLLVIGHAVDRAAAANSDMRKPLWRYVIKIIKSPMSEEEIVKVYNRLNRQAILMAGAPQPTAIAAAAPRNSKGLPSSSKKVQEHRPATAAGGGVHAIKRPAVPAAAQSQPAVAATAAGQGGNQKQQQPQHHHHHDQQHPPQQQSAVVHAGPRRALQLHKQPEQHKQPQQQLQDQQHLPQQQHQCYSRDRHADSRDRGRPHSRSGSRDRSQQQRCRSADRHHPAEYRGRSRSRDRHYDRRHRERSGSGDKYHGRRRHSRSRSRSRSRGRQRDRDHHDRHRD